MHRSIHKFQRRNGESFTLEVVIDPEAVARTIAESMARQGREGIVRRLDGAIIAKML